jgi:hypothetical protein
MLRDSLLSRLDRFRNVCEILGPDEVVPLEVLVRTTTVAALEADQLALERKIGDRIGRLGHDRPVKLVLGRLLDDGVEELTVPLKLGDRPAEEAFKVAPAGIRRVRGPLDEGPELGEALRRLVERLLGMRQGRQVLGVERTKVLRNEEEDIANHFDDGMLLALPLVEEVEQALVGDSKGREVGKDILDELFEHLGRMQDGWLSSSERENEKLWPIG